MSSSTGQEWMGEIADIIGHVRSKGVRLWAESGELRYKAPKGALTYEEVETLRQSRGRIIAFLERSASGGTAEPKLRPRQQPDRAPLTFSQLAAWRFRRLDEQPSVRQIASATRLRGRLDVELLQESLARIVRRHEALRTRVVVCDMVPTQIIAESGHCELAVDDLTALPEGARENEVRRLIDQLILEPVRVATGPLLGVRVARLQDQDHVLIVAMEHMISDAFSLNILLRDLLTAYRQLSSGDAVSLPEIPIQFADYAVWQQQAHESWLQKHGTYWDERLQGCGRVRFPEAGNLPQAGSGWGTIPLRIGTALKAELLQWSRLRHTTLVMSVFTAFVALVLRWCNAPESVIRYQTDGRAMPGVENTIGYFASILHLRIELHGDVRFVDLLRRVTDEYCKAYEHADFCFIDAQLPQPAFAANSAFNWVSQEPTSSLPAAEGALDTLTAEAFGFDNPVFRKHEKDSEPVVLLYDTADGIIGGVYFPLQRFSGDLMERFARNFMVFIKELLSRPEQRVSDTSLR